MDRKILEFLRKNHFLPIVGVTPEHELFRAVFRWETILTKREIERQPDTASLQELIRVRLLSMLESANTKCEEELARLRESPKL